MNTLINGIFKRDMALAFRQRSELAQPLMFLLMVITLFPLGIGPGPVTLQKIGPGVIWIAAILSSLLAMERLFRDDFWDGSLEQYMLSGQSVAAIAAVKVLVHWLVSFLTAGTFFTVTGTIFKPDGRYVYRLNANPGAGHTVIVAGWGNRGRVNGRFTTWWCVVGVIVNTGVYSVIDICHLGGRFCRTPITLPGTTCYYWRHADAGDVISPLCNCLCT